MLMRNVMKLRPILPGKTYSPIKEKDQLLLYIIDQMLSEHPTLNKTVGAESLVFFSNERFACKYNLALHSSTECFK